MMLFLFNVQLRNKYDDDDEVRGQGLMTWVALSLSLLKRRSGNTDRREAVQNTVGYL